MIIRTKGPHQLYQSQQAQESCDSNPLKGKKIHIHSSSFKIGLDEFIRAMDGPPAWVLRLKRIEDWMERILAIADLAWAETAVEYQGDDRRFMQVWLQYVEEVDYGRVNKWIRDHNEYFPIEANLPYDIHTGKIMNGGRPFEEKESIGSEWLLGYYPPDPRQAIRKAYELFDFA